MKEHYNGKVSTEVQITKENILSYFCAKKKSMAIKQDINFDLTQAELDWLSWLSMTTAVQP